MSIPNWLRYCLILSFSPLSHGSVINGDFASGLSGWTVLGDVTAAAEEALAADDGAGAGSSSLYQGVALAPGSYQLSFDFLGELSSSVPPGTFPDLFGASLYFIDDPISNFDLINGVFDAVISLFDQDASGLLAPIGGFNGGAGSSPKGTSWTRWTVNFNNQFDNAIPTFETFDGNFLADSRVRIDNVSINPVAAAPLPSSAALLLLALATLRKVRRRAA